MTPVDVLVIPLLSLKRMVQEPIRVLVLKAQLDVDVALKLPATATDVTLEALFRQDCVLPPGGVGVLGPVGLFDPPHAMAAALARTRPMRTRWHMTGLLVVR